MVAGYHNRADARLLAFCHRKFRFLPRGIYKSGKSDQYHIFFIGGFVTADMAADVIPAGQRQHTQGVACVRERFVVDIPTDARGEWAGLAVDADVAAPFQNDFRRAFRNAQYAGLALVEGRHHFSFGIERKFVNQAVFAAGCIRMNGQAGGALE